MLAENADLHLSSSQIETMLCAVVQRHMTKLERVAAAAKSAFGFDVAQARSDDKRALWTYTLLDAQGATAVVRQTKHGRRCIQTPVSADVRPIAMPAGCDAACRDACHRQRRRN